MLKIVTAIGLIAMVQAPSPAQSYTGTWVAELSGTTYVRLELQGTSTVTGRISLGNIQLGNQGEVTKADPAPREFRPLLEVARRDTHLSFASKETGELDRFELRLVSPDAADLLFIPTEEDKKELLAAGIGIPKPIRLKKVSS
jgi:hypothetical protein